MMDRNKKKKMPPMFGDLVNFAEEMRRSEKGSEEYKNIHKKACDLVEFLNKENGEGYCNLSVANACLDERYKRNKVKLAKGV